MRKINKIMLLVLACAVLLSLFACTGKPGEQNATEVPATEVPATEAPVMEPPAAEPPASETADVTSPENAHTAILESGEEIRFEKNSDPKRSQSYIDVYRQRLSDVDLRILFGGLPVSATAICRKGNDEILGYAGKIGDCILHIETAGLTLGDTIIEGSEGISHINGVSVAAGYYLEDENSGGKSTIFYYACFTLGGARYYLEQSAYQEYSELLRQNVAESARNLIAASPKAGDPYGGIASEKTKNFTEKEALINDAYHALFPERTDYIAFWAPEENGIYEIEAGQLFWAPESINFPSVKYPKYAGCRYELIELDGMYAFVFVEQSWETHTWEKAMYVAFIRPDGTLSSAVSAPLGTNYEYRMFTLGGNIYLAVETAYTYHVVVYWNSHIVDLTEEKIVWDESEWYENNDGYSPDGSGTDKHILRISDGGFTVYERELANGYHRYEETGFLSFAELLGYEG